MFDSARFAPGLPLKKTEMEVMYVKYPFRSGQRRFKAGELYLMNQHDKEVLKTDFFNIARNKGKKKYENIAVFSDIDNYFKKATINKDFQNLLIFRAGGIGDLIALTSIFDYFEDKNLHLVTQKYKYHSLFEW